MKTTLSLIVVFFVLIGFESCKQDHSTSTTTQWSEEDKKTAGLFNLVDPKVSGLNFENEIKDSLLMNVLAFPNSYNGSGVCIGDINNDGLSDVYFGSSVGSNKLFLNLGNLKFKDITAEAGVDGGIGIKSGVSMADVNGDGLLDIYVCKTGNTTYEQNLINLLYINKGNNKFEEEGAKYGVNDSSYTNQAYFADFDIDGDLDMYLVNHPMGWGTQNNLRVEMGLDGKYKEIIDTSRFKISDRIYYNENGKLVDKSKTFNFGDTYYGLSASIFDVNNDNYPDVYVCNDFTGPDLLYINQKGKGFKNEIDVYFRNISTSCMGSDVFDLNNDGLKDLMTLDMMSSKIPIMKQNVSYVGYDAHMVGKMFKYHDQFRYNALQIRTGEKSFSNISQLNTTSSTDWSWSVLGEDFDQNGFTDIFVSNGYLKEVQNMDYMIYQLDSLEKIVKIQEKGFFEKWLTVVKDGKKKNFLFMNKGHLNLTDASDLWNSGPESCSNGAAYGDLDNDGDLDLVVNNINQAAFLMENTLNKKQAINYVSLQLKPGDKNTFGVGSTVNTYFTDGTMMSRSFFPIRGFLSSSDYRILTNIPAGKTLKEIVVIWPGGKTETFGALPLNKQYVLEKGKGKPFTFPAKPAPIYASQNLPWKHVENEFIDFKRQPLLHLKNSVEGPTLSIGDVNGDGEEDMFAGGAAGQSSALFLQKNGKFTTTKNSAFIQDSMYEDVASSLFDADGDKDLDLVVASGGSQWTENSPNYALRLYVNDGKGNFTRTNALDNLRMNASCIQVGDFDKNGTLDLFVGGHTLPNAYPQGEKSKLLLNQAGKWTDASQMLPNGGDLGITKDAKVADINKDGSLDLVTATEWGAVKILINKGQKWEDQTEAYGITNSDGLWQSIAIDDIDNDGDLDIFAGNIGANCYFKPTIEQPLEVYLYDFDDNGELDPIMTAYDHNKKYPIHGRDELLGHMTTLRKKFLRYRDYAFATIEDCFGKDKVAKAKVFEVQTLENSIFVNENGKFQRHALPVEAQLSTVKGITKIGSNYVLVGNFWDTDFDFGKYDASNGVVLSYQKPGFKVIENTGLMADGNIREIQLIKIKGNQAFIVAGNNEVPKLYTVK